MTVRIPMDVLLDRLAQRGIADERAARRALRATLAVLAERLVEDEAAALADIVPAELARSVEKTEYDSDFGADELFERVRRRERTSAGRAREDAQVVLMTLGDCMDFDRRRRIARGLPEQAAALFLGGPERAEPPPHGVAPVAPRSATLASARPGSAHPVSEAAPPSGQMHSVAVNPSPHEETKLSAAKGFTQERLEETLGAGRPPGPTRPVAGAREK